MFYIEGLNYPLNISTVHEKIVVFPVKWEALVDQVKQNQANSYQHKNDINEIHSNFYIIKIIPSLIIASPVIDSWL